MGDQNMDALKYNKRAAVYLIICDLEIAYFFSSVFQ